MRPGAVVHTDLVEINEYAYGKEKYFVTLIDENSNIWVKDM